MKEILFVCSGNTCRSPIAEGVFNFLARGEDVAEKFHASSAGLHAYSSSANEISVQLCKKDGIDISSHRSQPLSREIVDKSNLILAMTGEQKRQVLRYFSNAEGKVFTLKKFVGDSGDIEDPIGQGEGLYEKVYAEIKKSVEKIFEKVKKNEGSFRQ